MKNSYKKIKDDYLAVLLIIDGWGIASVNNDSTFRQTKTPYIDELVSKYPAALLKTNGLSLSHNYITLGGGGKNCLSNIIEKNDLSELKIASVEKYAYLSYFFNSKNETKRKNEDRLMIDIGFINDYAKKPEMDSGKIADQIIKAIKDDRHNLIIASVASLDMVSATKDKKATEIAVRAIDKNIKKIGKAILNQNGSLFITACKGENKSLNIQKREDEIVPFLMISHRWEGITTGAGEVPGSDLSLMKVSGTLADVAPTILGSMGIKDRLPGNDLLK